MTTTSRIAWPWRRSLRARLVAYFLLLSTVTVLVVGAVVYLRATGDLTAGVYDRLDAVASVKSDSLERWIDEQTRNIVYVGAIPGFGDDARTFLDPAASPAAKGDAATRLRGDLKAIVGNTADAEEIFILDLDGKIRLSTLAEHEGMTQTEQPYFSNGSSHTTVQNVYTSPLTQRPTITVATPLFDQNGGGQRVAVLAADLSLQRLDRIILERTGLGESGRTYLVDKDGRLIQGATLAGQGNVVDSEGIRQVRAGQTGEGLYVDDRGVPVIGVYRWIADRGAGILAEVSQDEAFASARQLALVIGLVGLVSAVLLAGGIWFVARRVTRPILQLAATAAKVTAGDLDAVSGIQSEDEVGTLAVAFDEMTSELRANVATLERRVQDRTAELDRQKSYFESLVDVSPVAIVTMDRDERVSGWNPAATTLFGFEPEEAIGRNIDDLVLKDASPRDPGHDLTRRAAQRGRAHEIGQRVRKDGSVIDAEVLVVPLVVHGEQLGYYAIYHDITELNAARRDADSANQAKSAFLAAMSHEIRTPMNAVIGMSGLLLDTPLDTDQRDYTETIHTSGEALLTIINDILDFSKIEAGRFELDAHPFALAATIEGALDVMGPIAAKKGLELVYALDPDLPGTLVGDAGRLRQIVLNLLSNAIKFTDTGEITVNVTGSRLDAGDAADGPGRWAVNLEIHDTGIGIPADRVGRLFQSFSQADASISRKYGGTGLGLAISRRLAELMDGSLVAESAGIPGEGSTFRLIVHLPASADQELAAPSPAVDLHGRRVLVVDDNATNLRILVSQLERLGLTVTATGSPLEARDLAAAPDAGFDVVVTDLRMPDLDGLALAAAIRSTRGADGPPIIVLSSLGQRDREADAVAAFLTKPVKPAALSDTLGQVLSGSVVQAAPRAPDRWTIDPTMADRAPAAVAPGGGQCGQSETRHTAPRADGLHDGYRRRRSRGDRRARGARLRRRPDGCPDARTRRSRGHSAYPRPLAGSRTPDRRDDGQCHGGRPRDLPRGGHGRLRVEADPPRRIGAGPDRGPDRRVKGARR